MNVKESDTCVVVHLSEKRVGQYGVGNDFNEEEFIICGDDKSAFEAEVKTYIEQYEGVEGKDAFLGIRNALLDAVKRFKKRRTEYPGIIVQSDLIRDSAYVIVKSPTYGDDMNQRWDYELPYKRRY